MNQTTLFLDDCPFRTKAFRREFPFATTVGTAYEAIKLLHDSPSWDWVFLDHDLGGETFVNSLESNTGMEVVRWIVKFEPQIKQIVVHSMNGPAATEMTAKLRDAGYEVIQQSFGWIDFQKVRALMEGK